MQRLDAFKNLMVMASADGSLSDREIEFLADRCHKWGLTDAQFAEAISYAMSPSSHLTIPNLDGERRAMLGELIQMMAADGQLADIEKNLFAVAAAQMGVGAEELDAMIDKLLAAKGK